MKSSGSKDSDIKRLLLRLDGSGNESEWNAARRLADLLGDRLPDLLLAHFKSSSRWQVRNSCVYFALRFAGSDAAVTLALLGIRDKAKAVRYRSCMLLACSQRREVLAELREVALTTPVDTKDDLLAAIDAIESGNKDYFVDRSHSGLMTLTVDVDG